MKLQVIERTPDFACGIFGPVAIAAWEGVGTLQDAQTATQMLRAMADSHEEILMLGILGPNASPAPSEVRDLVSGGIRDLGPKLRGVAAVVEGQGFRGAAVRAALLGITMVLRPAHPQKSYATVAEAVVFLAHQKKGLKEAALLQAISELRQR